mmetsp:Transcript_5591/g.13125  ORF Transcript_5591/g.13125 Transcript_5591/m.13125 type:complete len:161 (+) Transcript_5591:1360-1842(+)
MPMAPALDARKFFASVVNTAPVTQAPPQVAKATRKLKAATGDSTVTRPLAIRPKKNQDPEFTMAPKSNVARMPIQSTNKPLVKVINPEATWHMLMVLISVVKSNFALRADPKVPKVYKNPHVMPAQSAATSVCQGVRAIVATLLKSHNNSAVRDTLVGWT